MNSTTYIEMNRRGEDGPAVTHTPGVTNPMRHSTLGGQPLMENSREVLK